MMKYDETIATVSEAIFAENNFSTVEQDEFYKKTPLTSKGKLKGYSYSYFNILIVQTTLGKSYITIKDAVLFHLLDSPYGSKIEVSPIGKRNGFTRIVLSAEDDNEILEHIVRWSYVYCLQKVKSEFDCCSRYMACSDRKKCVNPMKELYVLCSYRKKLDRGIIFFGDNRNID